MKITRIAKKASDIVIKNTFSMIRITRIVIKKTYAVAENITEKNLFTACE